MRAITVDPLRAALLVRGIQTIHTTAHKPKIEKGERIAIHASAARPAHCLKVGPFDYLRQADADRICDTRRGLDEWIEPVTVGAIVGSAVLIDCVPIIHAGEYPPRTGPWITNGGEWLAVREVPDISDITDQLPLGDFTPGRWAWLLGDAAPVEERCPACWALPDRVGTSAIMRHVDCPVFHRGMKPIHMKGKQGIWQVTW